MEQHELEKIAKQRAEATNAIVASISEKKLVVAGPGTGKTFTFRQALGECGGRGLALTFIRNLVRDLRVALEDVADVYTFHGFCKYQLHRNPVDGLGSGWHYYPPLLDLTAHDLVLVDKPWSKDDLTHALHTLDEAGGEISEVLRLGSYYNAVHHADVVYRVLRHFEEHTDKVPTFPLIVVDEYQDFSEMETTFIQLLASKSNVLIAGDDDQALYGFKGADPRFIRELAEGGEYERFPLPFCSRCTNVVVAAVNDVVRAGVENGNLDGRLDKEFDCYVPEKAADSEAHPAIIHAVCSVQSKKAPYVGRYIIDRINAIPNEDIRDSDAGGYPTVLVIGPNPFLDAAFDTISEVYPQAQLRKAEQSDIDSLDGYRLLAKDERSRLGWRIILACDAFAGSDEVLVEVTRYEAELVDLLPDDYRKRHLVLARVVGRLQAREELTAGEKDELSEATGMGLDEVLRRVHAAENRENEDTDGDSLAESPGTESEPGPDRVEPSIICTSLTGAKGLSAAYVFLVGFNNGHFPRDPAGITDQEVCQFLVGLSRTRKACHLISVRHYGTGWLTKSRFLEWISEHVQEVAVDKGYFDR
jgi:ATP-dependent DNA helicase UvrD/PcrA